MKQPHIGIIRAMAQSVQYKKATVAERDALRSKRLRAMVAWARENSPYYAELYRSIRPDFSLADLPPVNKVNLMAHWDEWPTDRAVHLADAEEFMHDLDHIGRKWLGKYILFTTSGSTGNPLTALCDSTTYNVMAAVNGVRSIARKEDMAALIRRGGKTIGVFATGGFYLGNSSARARLLQMPWKKRQMAIISALLPIEQIVEKLNDFQPAMLGGYPSNLELLIEEKQSGRLKIHPAFIMTGGEYLSDALRLRLSDCFGCYVQTSYSCTEGGTVACECIERHFHINDDWVIVEPVDSENNPVPAGVRSDKILLTNLFNFTQPFIRYEITDRVILHDEPCACGNPSPWLELEGRTDDVVRFTQDGREIKLAPLAIYATLKEVHQLRRFQLIALPENLVELRIIPAEGGSRDAAFQSAKIVLGNYFALHGVTQVRITLSGEEPKQDAGSGKFKHIICRT
ncbi:MAG: phenylacetate--CoA ligase family protein [Clostridiaceae bacterium]